MNNEEICFLSAVELAALIRSKELSPVEVTEAVLERIERLNPALNAVCTSMAEGARETAQRAELAVVRGESLGPLHGVPVTLKDLIHVKGVRTTFGSKPFADFVPTEDAPVVERLRLAGAVFVGRTNSPEFGWKAVTDNLLFGITRNPWNLELTPGGSSGGAGTAAAVGMGPIAIGSDGGGSIRIPSSFCGLVGYKCSFGRVPNYPVSAADSLLHTGPLTRTVADAALTMNVLAGPDERDPCSLPADNVDYLSELDHGIEGARIAYSSDLGFAQVHPDVARICEQAALRFGEAGASIESVDLDWKDPFKFWSTIFYGGIATTLGTKFEQDSEQFDPGLGKLINKGLKMTAVDYVRASIRRNWFWQTVHETFERFDLLITPTVAVPPFPVGKDNADPLPGHERWTVSWTPFTYPFNVTGQPAVSVPCGWLSVDDASGSEVPIGLQIIGRRFDDLLVLQAARAFEQIQPWSDRRPQVEAA